MNTNNPVQNPQNNIWTLTKHVAHSINNTAAKVDIKLYGAVTNSPKQAAQKADTVTGPFIVFVIAVILCGLVMFFPSKETFKKLWKSIK
jgi:type IV secretory pathway VirB2 component (pilin)